jgi:glycosyltransferase involved in cell wall biosynthesis
MSSSWQQSREQPFVSVIVPVYNDAERLKKCLEALEAQTYPSDAYEVIAVDNNSDEGIEKVVQDCPHASSEFEEKQGSYAARNRGIQRAQGSVFAFTDADCIPEKDWIEKGVRRLQAEGSAVGVVGGDIKVTFQYPDYPKPAEILDAMTGFAQKDVCTKRNFSATANLFTFRRVVKDVGAFNGRLKSAGDKEFGQRVAAHGYKVVYEPKALVCHPARKDPRALFEKRLRLAKGQYNLRVERQGTYSPLDLLHEFVNHLRPMKGMVPRILADPRFVSPSDRVVGILIYVIMELIFPVEKIRLWVNEKK